MSARSLSFAAIMLVAGCASLDGLTGGGDDLVEPPGTQEGPTGCGTPNAPRCEHGRCVDSSEGAKCECEEGWAGPRCADCAVGGPCAGASCEETTCAPHSVCDDSSGRPRCTCVTGYVESDGECAWSGVVADPGFQDAPAGSWELSGGVTINAEAEGFKDPGIAQLKTATCTSASAKQSIVMPPFELAGPLAMEVWGTGLCSLPGPFPPFGPGTIPMTCSRPISIRIAGHGIEPLPFAYQGAPESGRICLGERAFAGRIPVEVYSTSCSSMIQRIVIDHLDIAPAPECPSPGEIPNADFEGTGGWVASGTGAEVASGVGNNGSRGGRLHLTERCTLPTLTGTISVPLSNPARPALTFTMNGTKGRRMRIYANDQRIGVVTGTSVFEKVSVCLPEYLKGMVASLEFVLENDGGSCGTPDNSLFVFDDLKIEADPTCDAPAFIVDGGFEHKDSRRYWLETTNGGTVSYVKGVGARTGSGYGRITQSSCGAATSFSTLVTLPPPTPGAGGPVVEFYYKASSASGITYRGLSQTLTATNEWTKFTRCYPPGRGGFMQSISFQVSAAESCGFGSLSIDDVRVGLDPSCPE